MQQGLQRLLYLFEDCVLDVDRRELRRGTDTGGRAAAGLRLGERSSETELCTIMVTISNQVTTLVHGISLARTLYYLGVA